MYEYVCVCFDVDCCNVSFKQFGIHVVRMKWFELTKGSVMYSYGQLSFDSF